MTTRVCDDGGDEMTLFDFNGFKYPDFPSKVPLRNLSNVKIRSDDVLVCAYPKSGTHWLWEIVRLLLAGRLDTDNISKMAYMLEFTNEDDYRDLPSPRLLNTHVLVKHLPREVKVNKPKILYLTRNPKDIAVSYYSFIKKLPFQKYSGEWKNYVEPFCEGRFDYGSWFEYVKDWEEVKKTAGMPILTMNFEDLKQDTVGEAKRLCEFLGVDRSDEFITQVCEQCQFESLKKLKATATVTGQIAYRKGQVGDWKNWFTVAQNERFDRFYQEKMADCPLSFKYTTQ
ncbi:sulfotransferase 1A2-like [Haliotis rufescens]|uniref:sulfotransferase 1A2-like n=1 Tax=Haliotis rufescens TaxID=6454 RepID=UPI00201FB1A5|nr:sulfotransferase 1A2-like [Haliotis rufescens]